jgi:microcystin-dependent protein
MNRRSFFSLFTAFLAVPSLLKKRNETVTISAAEMPSHSHTLVPPLASGTILAYAGTEPPTGWVLCDGGMISRETYPGLFANIRDPGHSHTILPTYNFIRKV